MKERICIGFDVIAVVVTNVNIFWDVNAYTPAQNLTTGEAICAFRAQLSLHVYIK
jgi:hypothetical protein